MCAAPSSSAWSRLTLDLHAARWTAPDRYEIRADARRFEAGRHVAGKLALGVAVDYALGFGLQAIRDRIAVLAGALREGLAAHPGVTVRNLGVVRSGIVSFTVEGCEPSAVLARLREQGINVWTSWLTSTRLDMAARGLDGVVRASVHYYNTEGEVDRLAELVAA